MQSSMGGSAPRFGGGSSFPGGDLVRDFRPSSFPSGVDPTPPVPALWALAGVPGGVATLTLVGPPCGPCERPLARAAWGCTLNIKVKAL